MPFATNTIKKNLLLCVFLVLAFCCFSQAALMETESAENVLRFSLWSLLEDEPSLEKEALENFYDKSVQELKILAPFLLEGMIYGWSFSYVPSDIARQVAEELEVLPLVRIALPDERLSFLEPRVENERFYVWLEYRRTNSMMAYKKAWDSVVYPKAKGIGQASLLMGTEGILEAYEQALKNAIRGFVQKQEKNKPRRISGRVLLVGKPMLGIQAGRYTAALDFFVHVIKIERYTEF